MFFLTRTSGGEMANFYSRFVTESISRGCGFTIDSHKTGQDFDVVQYLWASPLQSLSDERIDVVIEEITDAAKRAGFAEADVAPYVTSLPNESAVLDSCPFQPQMCLGQHLVVSGSGKVH